MIITAGHYAASTDYVHVEIIVGVFASIILLTYITFISSSFIVEKLGSNLIAVIGKLMGLIIAIIGMDMLIGGIKLAFKI